MNYETMAVMDVVLGNDDIVSRIKYAFAEGLSADAIALELLLFFEGACPATGYDVYDYLLEHAIEEVDYNSIVQVVLSN